MIINVQHKKETSNSVIPGHIGFLEIQSRSKMLNWIATCSLKEVRFFPALIYLVREDFLPPRKYDS